MLRMSGLGAFVLTISGLLGCAEGGASPTRYSVSGKLVFRSHEPVKGVEIQLVPTPKEGMPLGMDATCLLEQDGTFRLKSIDGLEGVHEGKYVVVVRPYSRKASERAAAMKRIPRHFWSEDTSRMTVEITGEKTNWVVDLHSKG